MAEKEKEKAAKVKRPTPLKRKLQSEKKRLLNKCLKSKVKTAVKTYETSLTEKNAEKIKESLSAVFSLMDKGVKTGVFKKNKSARTKSRLFSKQAS